MLLESIIFVTIKLQIHRFT